MKSKRQYGGYVKRLENPEGILFISMGGIGNMVMLTPAIQIVGRRWPNARLHFLLSRNNSRQVVEAHPQIGSIVETDNRWHDILNIGSALKRLRPDMVFSATGTNPLNCGLLGLISGSKVRLGEAFKAGRLLYNVTVPYGPMQHEVPANVKISRAVVPGDDIPPLKVWSTADDVTAAKSFVDRMRPGEPLVGFHLGSGPSMEYKRWPFERFVELGGKITNGTDAGILIFGGEEERRLAEQAAAMIGERAVCCAGELNVPGSFEAMKMCRVFICNDTGPMHLAAAAGCRVVALFGPTLDFKTRPWGDNHIIIKDNIDCRPCYRYRQIKCKTLSCMKNISVDRVLSAITESLV